MAEPKLNILFTSGWYPNRVHPTLGNFVQKHAEAVARKANVIALSVCSDAGCKEKFELTEQTINGVCTINVYYRKVTHGLPLLSQFQKLKRNKKAFAIGLEKVDKKFRHIDLVHHNILFPSGMLALQLKQTRNIPYIVSEHSTQYLSSKNVQPGIAEQRLSIKIAGNAAAIVPVSKDLELAMIRHGLTGNYSVICNVADTTLFYPAGSRSTPAKIRFLHVSTLDDAHKNISGMLRAIAVLSKVRNDFECVFAGDGDTAPHIETAKILGIYESFVRFEGTKTTAEIAALMRAADCFLMFSNYENMPVVIIEALASGIPVLSSNVGGIREHIIPERGMLIPPLNEETLAETMTSMILNIREGRYSAAGLAAYADEHFSYEKVGEQFLRLYRQILQQHV